jgi:outer membrane cobalamin receptor
MLHLSVDKFRIILLCSILFFQFDFLFSQTQDSLKEYYLGEIEITANRERTKLYTSRDEVNYNFIETTDALSISEAVKFLPGIRVANNSKNEMSVDIRGYTQRQVTILLDGVPIYVPFDGMIDLSLIPVENVDKISVVKGASSILYGPNSMGGIINIITGESTTDNNFNLKAASGTNISNFYNFRKYGKKGIVSYYLSSEYIKSNGFKISEKFKSLKEKEGNVRDNSDYVKKNLFSKVIISPSVDKKLGLSFHYVNNEKGLPPSIASLKPRYWRFANWDKWVLNATGEFIVKPDFMIKSMIFYDKYYNVLDSYDDQNYNSQLKKYAFHSTYDDHSTGGMLYAMYDVRKNNFLKFSTSLKYDVHKEQGNRNQAFQRYEMCTYSFGAEDELTFGSRFSMIFGSGIDIISPVFANDKVVPNNFNLFKPQFGLIYALSENSSFHFSIGKKSRFPTLKELYSEYIGSNVPNPNLRAENSISTESGIKFISREKYNGTITLFYDNIKDLIVNVPLGNGERKLDNIGKVISGGIETALRITYPVFSYEINYTLLKMKNVSPNRTSNYVEYHPEHRLNLLFSSKIKYGFHFYSELFYNGKQKYINLDTGEWGTLTDYGLVNVKISKSFLNNSVYLRINNVFDVNYQSEFGFPQEGRNFMIGIDFKI